MKYENTHESIAAQEDKPFTNAQSNYLASLYSELLESYITPKSEMASQNEHMKYYFKFGDGTEGTLAKHFFETFGVNQKLTKNSVSLLISNAKYNKKFDKKLAKAWIVSNNKFLKAYRAEQAQLSNF